MSELLQANQPVKFTARNHRPKYKRLRAGDFYGGDIEYDKETWETLKTIPDNAIIEVILYWHDGDEVQPEAKPTKKKKESKPKGEHGAFWTGMFKKGFQFSLELWEVLGVESGERVKDLLHEEFEVESLSFVSPKQFENWAYLNKLDTLVSMSRQEAVKYESASEMVS